MTAPCAGVVGAVLAPEPRRRRGRRPGGGGHRTGHRRVEAGRTGSRPRRARGHPDRRTAWAPVLDEVRTLQDLAARAPGPGLRRPRRRPPAQPGQAHLPGAHRPAARRRVVPRGRQRGRLRLLRRRRRRSPPSRRPTTWAAGAASKADRRSSAPTTSPPGAATPTAPSGPRASTSTACRWSCASPRSACSTAPPAAAAWPPWCPSSARRARARPGRARAPSPPAGPGWPAAAVRSCPATWAAPSTPSSSPPCRWSTCCWAAWSASGRPRPCSATSRSWCATSPSCSWPARRWWPTPWATTSPRRTSATGTSTAATARSTTWPRPRRRRWRMTRRFLSYLPSSVYEAPPVLPPDPADPPDRREDELVTLIPRKRTTTFDVRRAIELMADRGSFFEMGPLWGTDQVSGFVRFDGHPVGRHRLRQPPRQRRRPHRRRLHQADPPPRPVRPVPPAGAQPGRQPGLRRGPRARDRRHHPPGRRVDGGLRPGQRADLHRGHAAQLRGGRQQLRHPAEHAVGAGGLAGGRRRRHPARGRHRGGLQAPAGRGGRPRRPAGRAGGPHRERPGPGRARCPSSRSRR